jgi:hypothetical protein
MPERIARELVNDILDRRARRRCLRCQFVQSWSQPLINALRKPWVSHRPMLSLAV